jgi:hypothetical protein
MTAIAAALVPSAGCHPLNLQCCVVSLHQLVLSNGEE